MKLTKRQLRTMIREEVSRTVLNEEDFNDGFTEEDFEERSEELIDRLKRTRKLSDVQRGVRDQYFLTFMAMLIEDGADYRYYARMLQQDRVRENVLGMIGYDADGRPLDMRKKRDR